MLQSALPLPLVATAWSVRPTLLGTKWNCGVAARLPPCVEAKVRNSRSAPRSSGPAGKLAKCEPWAAVPSLRALRRSSENGDGDEKESDCAREGGDSKLGDLRGTEGMSTRSECCAIFLEYFVVE